MTPTEENQISTLTRQRLNKISLHVATSTSAYSCHDTQKQLELIATSGWTVGEIGKDERGNARLIGFLRRGDLRFVEVLANPDAIADFAREVEKKEGRAA